MMMVILIFQFWISGDVSSKEPMTFCEMVEAVIAQEKLESTLQFESVLLGKCIAIVDQTDNVKKVFGSGIGEYNCKSGRVVILSDAELFANRIEKGIRFDRIKVRKDRVDVTYSILEFYLDGKPGGLKRRTIVTKKISVSR